MAECPACGFELDMEEDEVDEGDVVSCDECGATLTVVSLNPIEIEEVAEEDSSDDDEDFDEDSNDPWKAFRGY